VTEAPLIRMGPTFEQDWPGANARATECVMNLLRTATDISERLTELLRPYDLTPTQAQVLSIIHGAREPLPHHTIGERLVVARGTVSFLVDTLERRGFVRRVPHPNSRRTVLVAITEEAERLLHQFRPRIHQMDRDLVAGLCAEEQDALLGLLGRIQARVATSDDA
jgi:MarR family transcriptional regulator, 2-MHQ and catechol-resistance regulon repressor